MDPSQSQDKATTKISRLRKPTVSAAAVSTAMNQATNAPESTASTANVPTTTTTSTARVPTTTTTLGAAASLDAGLSEQNDAKTNSTNTGIPCAPKRSKPDIAKPTTSQLSNMNPTENTTNKRKPLREQAGEYPSKRAMASTGVPAIQHGGQTLAEVCGISIPWSSTRPLTLDPF
ncbi:hypothetical protein CDD82_5845 [Ophiocordyceps australis]|uniref:Uncharacterized protein n=1 Tax=Ophiocordyceps australis TaxID=1399860 RepID=A0A2C5YV97_9HYPO|nr:hypothetical protein CDD82_5845 [Ophiocordyceps australis]